MVEKLKIESFAQFYVLRKPDGTHAGTVDNLNDAHLYAASEMMLEALEAAFSYVLNYALCDDDYRANIDLQCPKHEEKLAKQLKAAIAAAKGE